MPNTHENVKLDAHKARILVEAIFRTPRRSYFLSRFDKDVEILQESGLLGTHTNLTDKGRYVTSLLAKWFYHHATTRSYGVISSYLDGYLRTVSERNHYFNLYQTRLEGFDLRLAGEGKYSLNSYLKEQMKPLFEVTLGHYTKLFEKNG